MNHQSPHRHYFPGQTVIFCSKQQIFKWHVLINHKAKAYLHFGNDRGDANFTGLTGTRDGPGELSIQIGSSLLSPRDDISPPKTIDYLNRRRYTHGVFTDSEATQRVVLLHSNRAITHAQTVMVVTEVIVWNPVQQSSPVIVYGHDYYNIVSPW